MGRFNNHRMKRWIAWISLIVMFITIIGGIIAPAQAYADKGDKNPLYDKYSVSYEKVKKDMSKEMRKEMEKQLKALKSEERNLNAWWAVGPIKKFQQSIVDAHVSKIDAMFKEFEEGKLSGENEKEEEDDEDGTTNTPSEEQEDGGTTDANSQTTMPNEWGGTETKQISIPYKPIDIGELNIKKMIETLAQTEPYKRPGNYYGIYEQARVSGMNLPPEASYFLVPVEDGNGKKISVGELMEDLQKTPDIEYKGSATGGEVITLFKTEHNIGTIAFAYNTIMYGNANSLGDTDGDNTGLLNANSVQSRYSKVNDLLVCVDTFGNLVTNHGEIIVPMYMNSAVMKKNKQWLDEGFMKDAYVKITPKSNGGYDIAGRRERTNYFYITNEGGQNKLHVSSSSLGGVGVATPIGSGDLSSLIIYDKQGENSVQKYLRFSSVSLSVGGNSATVYNLEGVNQQFSPEIMSMRNDLIYSNIDLTNLSKIAGYVMSTNLTKYGDVNDIYSFGNKNAGGPSDKQNLEEDKDWLTLNAIKKITKIIEDPSEIIDRYIRKKFRDVYKDFITRGYNNAIFYTIQLQDMPVVAILTRYTILISIAVTGVVASINAWKVFKESMTLKEWFRKIIVIPFVVMFPLLVLPAIVTFVLNPIISSIILPDNFKTALLSRQQYTYYMNTPQDGTSAGLEDIGKRTEEMQRGIRLNVADVDGTTVNMNKYLDEKLYDIKKAKKENGYKKEDFPIVDNDDIIKNAYRTVSAWQFDNQATIGTIINTKEFSDKYDSIGVGRLLVASRMELGININASQADITEALSLDKATSTNALNKIYETDKKFEKIVYNVNKQVVEGLDTSIWDISDYVKVDIMEDYVSLIVTLNINEYFNNLPNTIDVKMIDPDLIFKTMFIPVEEFLSGNSFEVADWIFDNASWISHLVFILLILVMYFFVIIKNVLFVTIGFITAISHAYVKYYSGDTSLQSIIKNVYGQFIKFLAAMISFSVLFVFIRFLRTSSSTVYIAPGVFLTCLILIAFCVWFIYYSFRKVFIPLIKSIGHMAMSIKDKIVASISSMKENLTGGAGKVGSQGMKQASKLAMGISTVKDAKDKIKEEGIKEMIKSAARNRFKKGIEDAKSEEYMSPLERKLKQCIEDTNKSMESNELGDSVNELGDTFGRDTFGGEYSLTRNGEVKNLGKGKGYSSEVEVLGDKEQAIHDLKGKGLEVIENKDGTLKLIGKSKEGISEAIGSLGNSVGGELGDIFDMYLEDGITEPVEKVISIVGNTTPILDFAEGLGVTATLDGQNVRLIGDSASVGNVIDKFSGNIESVEDVMGIPSINRNIALSDDYIDSSDDLLTAIDGNVNSEIISLDTPQSRSVELIGGIGNNDVIGTSMEEVIGLPEIANKDFNIIGGDWIKDFGEEGKDFITSGNQILISSDYENMVKPKVYNEPEVLEKLVSTEQLQEGVDFTITEQGILEGRSPKGNTAIQSMVTNEIAGLFTIENLGLEEGKDYIVSNDKAITISENANNVLRENGVVTSLIEGEVHGTPIRTIEHGGYENVISELDKRGIEYSIVGDTIYPKENVNKEIFENSYEEVTNKNKNIKEVFGEDEVYKVDSKEEKDLIMKSDLKYIEDSNGDIIINNEGISELKKYKKGMERFAIVGDNLIVPTEVTPEIAQHTIPTQSGYKVVGDKVVSVLDRIKTMGINGDDTTLYYKTDDKKQEVIGLLNKNDIPYRVDEDGVQIIPDSVENILGSRLNEIDIANNEIKGVTENQYNSLRKSFGDNVVYDKASQTLKSLGGTAIKDVVSIMAEEGAKHFIPGYTQTQLIAQGLEIGKDFIPVVGGIIALSSMAKGIGGEKSNIVEQPIQDIDENTNKETLERPSHMQEDIENKIDQINEKENDEEEKEITIHSVATAKEMYKRFITEGLSERCIKTLSESLKISEIQVVNKVKFGLDSIKYSSDIEELIDMFITYLGNRAFKLKGYKSETIYKYINKDRISEIDVKDYKNISIENIQAIYNYKEGQHYILNPVTDKFEPVTSTMIDKDKIKYGDNVKHKRTSKSIESEVKQIRKLNLGLYNKEVYEHLDYTGNNSIKEMSNFLEENGVNKNMVLEFRLYNVVKNKIKKLSKDSGYSIEEIETLINKEGNPIKQTNEKSIYHRKDLIKSKFFKYDMVFRGSKKGIEEYMQENNISKENYKEVKDCMELAKDIREYSKYNDIPVEVVIETVRKIILNSI